MRTFFLSLILTLPLFATEMHFPKPPVNHESNEPIILHLRGVMLLGSKDLVNEQGLDGFYGVELKNLPIPTQKHAIDLIVEPHLGGPLTANDIIQLKTEIIEYYRRHDYPITYVEVPAQNISTGVLQLVVHEGKLGEVRCIGNKHFKSERLASYIRAKPNQPVDAEKLIKDLEWINRNPFRQTNSIFTPSGTTGMTDIELVTEDRFPLRVYAGVDNTGIRDTGRTRWFTGFNWGNAFGLDHILSFQFTTGNDISKYWSTSLHYTAPLSWRHTLVLYGGYSHAKADLTTPGMRTKGYSAQASFRYEIPIKPFIDFLEDFLFGFDWKRTNTNLDQDGDIFFNKAVNITQFMVGYNVGYETKNTRTSGTIEIYCSPGSWLPDQSRSRYQELRPGANNSYVYTRIAVAPIFTLPHDFSIETKFRLQWSSTNLLSSEQFGLGGWDTVRGYQVREVNDDNVVILNIEFRSCPIPVLKRRKKSIDDKLIFLVFWDYAYGRNHERFPGEPDHNNLMGVGPGVRYFLGSNLSFRGDLGYKVWQPEQSDNHTRWRFEFGLVGSF